jgi:hypothetical protein
LTTVSRVHTDADVETMIAAAHEAMAVVAKVAPASSS